MFGLKQWTWVAAVALLVLTVMAAGGGKAEKTGDFFFLFLRSMCTLYRKKQFVLNTLISRNMFSLNQL